MKHVDAHTIGYNTICPPTTNNGIQELKLLFMVWLCLKRKEIIVFQLKTKQLDFMYKTFFNLAKRQQKTFRNRKII